jgi:3-keto-disaccharide hydrolase
MKIKYAIVLMLSLGFMTTAFGQKKQNDWIPLFNGKNLDGWQVGENAASFSVENGTLKVSGLKAHLFYMGDVENHEFKNFEFKATVMTKPGANSGIYFHTKYQESGWPSIGYEVQVNNSQSDWKRTGSLYNILNVLETYVADNEWYTEYIKVEGKRVIIKINDIVVVDYTEPKNPKRSEGEVNRVISKGTFAIQAHDPGSVVYFKDIMVKPLK